MSTWLAQSDMNPDQITSGRVLDLCETRQSYIINLHGDVPVKVSSTAYRLLQALRDGWTWEDICAAVSCDPVARPRIAEQLQSAYGSLFQLLKDIERRTGKRSLPWGFWWRLAVIPAGIAGVVASSLHRLYQWWIPLCVGSLMILAESRALSSPLFDPKVQYSLEYMGMAYGLFIISLIIHEFGHATATHYFGGRPGDIGFAVYLIYPAFYSDVTACWSLKRWQRVVVDLGGCYFQVLFGMLLCLAFQWTHWLPLRLAFAMILYSCLFSLNPVFKFDGYWLLSDSLGVSNLTAQPKRIISFVYRRLLRRTPTPMPLPWPTWIIAVLAVYSCVFVAIWARFIIFIVPLVRSQIVHGRSFVAHVASGSVSLLSLRFYGTLFFSLYEAGLIVMIVLQLGRKLWPIVHREAMPQLSSVYSWMSHRSAQRVRLEE